MKANQLYATEWVYSQLVKHGPKSVGQLMDAPKEIKPFVSEAIKQLVTVQWIGFDHNDKLFFAY